MAEIRLVVGGIHKQFFSRYFLIYPFSNEIRVHYSEFFLQIIIPNQITISPLDIQCCHILPQLTDCQFRFCLYRAFKIPSGASWLYIFSCTSLSLLLYGQGLLCCRFRPVTLPAGNCSSLFTMYI